MADLEKFFVGFVSFFGILSVLGIYLGYMHLIVFPLNVVAIVVAFFGAMRVTARIGKTNDVIHAKHLVLILVFLLGIDLYMSMPYLVYPHSYVDFGLNTAQARLMTEEGGFPSFAHVYPNVYYGVFAIFDSLLWHSYSVSSVIAIVMQIMTVFAVFLIGREVYDEKTGLIAAFLYGFSLVNILLLEQGFLTQNFATFFFAALVFLALKSKNDRRYVVPLVFSLIALFSYPHYFAVAFVALLLFNRNMVKYVLMALAAIIPEFLGIVVHYATNVDATLNSFVMWGGIIVPNLFVLSLLALGVFGYVMNYRNMRKKNDGARMLYSATNALAFVIGVFILLFVINYFMFSITSISVRDLRQLYTVVKYSYLLFLSGSVFAAYALRKISVRYSGVFVLFMALYLAFFTGYAYVIPDKDNLPEELYFASEKMAELNDESLLFGFDECVFQNSWVQPRIYDTLYGYPDNYTRFSYNELYFVFQDDWPKSTWDNTYRGGGELNFVVGQDDADYIVSVCRTSAGDVIYYTGRLRVYENPQ